MSTRAVKDSLDFRSSPAAVIEAPAEAGKLPRTLTGLAVPYNVPTDLGNVIETVDPGAFRESLARQSALPLLTYHDSRTDPVGVATGWEHRTDGLHGTWELDHSTARGREVAGLAAGGFLRYLSIGFRVAAKDIVWSTGPDGREHCRIMRARLLEVSLVSTPAYVDAAVTGTRHAGAGRAALSPVAVDLGRRLGAPLMGEALTGSPQRVRANAELVLRFVEASGASAAAELAEFAASVSDPLDAVNYARAACALEDANPRTLKRIYLDECRRELAEFKARDATTGEPRRRRSRR